MSKCVLHPERDAKNDAQGIPVCPSCFNRYAVERRKAQQQQGNQLLARPFLRQLIVRYHGLKGAVATA